MESLTIKRLRTRSVFQFIFIGLFCSFVPLFTILGIMASLGMVNIYWDNEPVTGVKAVFLGPFYGVFFTIIFGLLIGILSSLGLILYEKFRPITFYFYSQEKGDHN